MLARLNCGDDFIIYTYIKSVCHTPETNTYYISIKIKF